MILNAPRAMVASNLLSNKKNEKRVWWSLAISLLALWFAWNASHTSGTWKKEQIEVLHSIDNKLIAPQPLPTDAEHPRDPHTPKAHKPD